jgi:hypothetical protein
VSLSKQNHQSVSEVVLSTILRTRSSPRNTHYLGLDHFAVADTFVKYPGELEDVVMELVGKGGHFAVVGSEAVVTPEAEVLVPDALIVEKDVSMTKGSTHSLLREFGRF